MNIKRIIIVTIKVLLIGVLISFATVLPRFSHWEAEKLGFPFPFTYSTGGCNCSPGEMCVAVPCLPHIDMLMLASDVIFWAFISSLLMKFEPLPTGSRQTAC